MGQQQNAEFYNRIFSSKGKWTTHYTQCSQYTLWVELVKHINIGETILELACGTGRLARMIHDLKPPKNYVGIDFSSWGIKYATVLTPEAFFICGDILKSDIIENHTYDTVIATEFLEHIHDDVIVLNRLDKVPRRIKVLFTVPAGQSMSIKDHVRDFKTEQHVINRYGQIIKNIKIKHIKPRFLITGHI